MEYSTLYSNPSLVNPNFQATEFSEVMVVHRMHVSLSHLNINTANSVLQPTLLEGSDKVKRLFIVADVVEVPTSSIFLPASLSVVILCRLLYVTVPPTYDLHGPAVTLTFPYMRLFINESIADFFPSKDDDAGLGCYIHADRIIRRLAIPQSDLRLRLIMNAEGPSTFSRDNWPISHFRFTQNTVTADEPLAMADSELQRSDEHEQQDATIQFPLAVITFSPWLPPSTSSMGRFLDTTRPPVFCYFQFRPDVPSHILTNPYIVLGMQVTLLFAELVQVAHNAPHLLKLVTKHVEWLNKLLHQVTSPNDDILGLLFRVQVFKRTSERRRFLVPMLQYHMYSNLINRMVQAGEAYDRDLKNLQFFIATNQILGNYLLQQNKAFAEREREMSGFHSNVVEMRRDELRNALNKMDLLALQMERENTAMQEARDALDKAILEYQRRQMANAILSVVRAVVSVALAFATAGATLAGAVASAGQAVSAAGQAAASLNKVVATLQALEGVMTFVIAIREVVDSLGSMNNLINAPEQPELPSDADWLIFVNEIEAVAGQMPEEVVGPVSVWQAKCKNVAVLGQEMCTTTARIGELTHQIKVEEMLQGIAQRQADRLNAISSPQDLSSFTEMLSEIDMRSFRLLLQLIKLLFIQNPALRYEYLFTTTEYLDTWPVNMETVRNVLIQQEAQAIQGLLQLGPSNDHTLTYIVKGIPVGLLVEGHDWVFAIPVHDFDAFPDGFSRVRIRYVELKFDAADQQTEGGMIHLPSTNTDLLYLLLQCSPSFADRKQQEVLDYEATSGVAYAYAYNLHTGAPTLTNIPSPEYANTFMRMTPFNTWRVRLSASAPENQGLSFLTANAPDDTTQITITFHFSAVRRIHVHEAEEF